MFKKSDPNSFSKNCALYDGDNEIGTLLLEYQVICDELAEAA